MTENPLEQKVQISIERNSQEEKLQEENEQLKSTLTEIASIEFSKQCQQYGIDPSTSSAYDLEVAKGVKKKTESELFDKSPRGGDSANVYSNYQEGTHQTTLKLDDKTDLNQLEFHSEEELLSALTVLSNNGNTQAKDVLTKLGQKVLKKHGNHEYEFNGDLKLLNRKPLKVSDMDTTEIQQLKEKHNSKLSQNSNSWKEVI